MYDDWAELLPGPDFSSSDRFARFLLLSMNQVRSADCIFVIKDGQVVEQGTHDGLIQEDGAYSALISRQMQAQKSLDSYGGDSNGHSTKSEAI